MSSSFPRLVFLTCCLEALRPGVLVPAVSRRVRRWGPAHCHQGTSVPSASHGFLFGELGSRNLNEVSVWMAHTTARGAKPSRLESWFCLLPALDLRQETGSPAFRLHDAGSAAILPSLVQQSVKESKPEASRAPLIDWYISPGESTGSSFKSPRAKDRFLGELAAHPFLPSPAPRIGSPSISGPGEAVPLAHTQSAWTLFRTPCQVLKPPNASWEVKA